MKYHLGCGDDYRFGWENVDISPDVETDIQADLDSQPWEWADTDSAEEVEARHVLEHLEHPVGAVREVARILQPGGRFLLVYPIGHTAFTDPTHTSYWTYETAEFFAGEQSDHTHEVNVGLELVDRDVDVWIDPHEEETYQRVMDKLESEGGGGWLNQVEGLAGEVVAVYRKPEG